MQTTPHQPANRDKIAELISLVRLLTPSDRQELKDYARAKLIRLQTQQPADPEAGVYLSDFSYLFNRLTEQERLDAVTFMISQIERREAVSPL